MISRLHGYSLNVARECGTGVNVSPRDLILLHSAPSIGQLDVMIRLLLDRGSNANTQDQDVFLSQMTEDHTC
jgi:hypothetical protein